MVDQITVLTTPEYERWRHGIKDKTTRNRIGARIIRLQVGLFGDTRSVGGGVHELKLDFGPGYRIYFARQGHLVVILLCGGDKSGQARDIATAHELWEHWKDGK
ncbi:MAG: type II toxin-antitoxin system RelE/ParE family toxin [Devosia sp.]